MNKIDYNKEPYLTFKKMYLEDKLSMAKIAKLNKCSVCKVQKFLEKFNITRDRIEAKTVQGKDVLKNANYFYNIDTEEKAYWLGFIMADGNINEERFRLKIDLNIQDKEHLQKLANVFDKKTKEFSRIDSRNNKKYYIVKCEINNKYFVNGLLEQGVTSKKSYTLNTDTFNNVPNYLKRHFIRGYFDGDGSTDGRRISFVSCSKDFLISIGNFINKELDISNYTLYEKDSYSVISWYKKENVDKFKNYFYNNSTIYLQRKLDKILKVQNNTNKKNHWKDEEILLLRTLTKEDFKNKNNIVNLFTNRTFDGIYRKYRRSMSKS